MNWQEVTLNLEKNEPLYKQVAQNIKRLIETQKIVPGDKIPTSKELQKQFRVSAITVEAGITSLVEENYLIRRPRLGTFVNPEFNHKNKNSTPSAEFSPVTNAVRIVFSNISANDIYWYHVLNTVESQLAPHGYEIILTRIDTDFPENTLSALAQGCRGVILCGYNSSKFIRILERNSIPLVLIGGLDSPDSMIDRLDAIVHDEIHRAYISTKHLLDLGHREIACVSGPTNSQVAEKHETGYRLAMNEADIPEKDQHIIKVNAHTIEEGMRAGYELFCAPNKPTGVFACGDRIAAGIINTAKKLGIKVPEELSVVGSGGLEICKIIEPRLTTTVSYPVESAKIAVRKLTSQINEKNYKKKKTVIKIEKLEFGESTMIKR